MYLVQPFPQTHTQIKFYMRIVYSLSYCLRVEGKHNAYPKSFWGKQGAL